MSGEYISLLQNTTKNMDGLEPRQCLLVMPAQLVSVKLPYQCRGRCTMNGRLYGWLNG